MSSRKEKPSRPQGGGGRARSAHGPTRSRRTCAGIRVRPAAEQAATSLHKPWQRPARGPRRRRSPCLQGQGKGGTTAKYPDDRDQTPSSVGVGGL